VSLRQPAMRGCPRWALVCLGGLLLASSGCALLRAPSKGTSALVRKVEGTMGIQQPTNMVALLQLEVMREADNYASAVAQAANDFAASVGTPQARDAALQWKLHEGTAAIGIAAGENPNLNAVDFVVLATLSRRTVEDYWVGEKYGKAALPLLETHRILETNAWAVVANVLSFEQRVELRDLIYQWSQEHPGEQYVGAVRLRDFLGVLGSQALQGRLAKPNTVLGLLDVDPFGGLDPAIRAVEQTRYFGERLMFYFERAPMLLSWQIEALTLQIAAQPAPEQVLSNLTSFAQSAQVFARSADQLPQVLDRERQAALNQVFAGVASERSNILATLNAQEAQLRELLPEVRRTLDAGSQMGASLNNAITSLDQFVHYVSPPETNPPPPSTNSHPFNVVDYGNAATRVAAMSRDLEALLTTANQSATQMARLGEQVGARADRAVDRAFRLGLVLIVLFLAGAVLAALAYRFLAARLLRGSRSSSSTQT